VGNRDLIPLRFPFSSIFPIIGCVFALLYLKGNKKLFYVCLLLLGIFYYTTHKIIVPRIVFYCYEPKEKLSIDNSLFEYEFYTIDDQPIKLKTLLNTKCTLIEAYFVGCRPCYEKEAVLKQLNNYYKSKPFSLIYICDGVITPFDRFKGNIRQRGTESATYLFDKDGVFSKKFNVHGYPLEVLTSQQNIVSVKDGFSGIIADLYLQNEINKINTILNE
jgi:hypothetical protein